MVNLGSIPKGLNRGSSSAPICPAQVSGPPATTPCGKLVNNQTNTTPATINRVARFRKCPTSAVPLTMICRSVGKR